MRIGVDAACVANERGYGRFARELLRAMVRLAPGDEFVCFVDARARERIEPAPNVRLVEVAQSASPTAAAAADGSRAPADMLRFSRAVWRERPNVFFSPSVYTYFPLPPALAAVVTVHDAIADRFPELTLPSRRARLFWRLKVGLALHQARLVLTVSEFAAREIAEVLGVPRARIRVAVEAPAAAYRPSETPADVAAAAARAGLPAAVRWFAYVGGFNPHKHVDLIVRAHAELVRAAPDAPPFLLLVGKVEGDVFHGAQAAIRAAIAECGTARYVCWAGFVPDEELRHLLSGAIALLLPSENEGFGLPAVEAAACGAPVVATTASPLPELLAGGGFFVAPRDLPALTDAMRRLAGDEPARRIMGARALEGARALSWERGAGAALGALREAAA
jgi:glycosyltransferase involved in cell wall biosynthesis